MASLPGVGRRTALRLVLHMLRRSEDDVRRFSEALVAMREGVSACEICGNLSESALCGICTTPGRTENLVAVVEDLRDLLAIEGTGHRFLDMGLTEHQFEGVSIRQLDRLMGILHTEESPLVNGFTWVGGEAQQPCRQEGGTGCSRYFRSYGIPHGSGMIQ